MESSSVMTQNEATILGLLEQKPGELVTTEAIIDALYAGQELKPKSNTIQVFVGRLRKKVAPRQIRAVRHKGYMIEAAPVEEPQEAKEAQA